MKISYPFLPKLVSLVTWQPINLIQPPDFVSNMSATKICDVACHLQRRLSIKVSLTECLQVNAFAEWIYSPRRFYWKFGPKHNRFTRCKVPGQVRAICCVNMEMACKHASWTVWQAQPLWCAIADHLCDRFSRIIRPLVNMQRFNIQCKCEELQAEL